MKRFNLSNFSSWSSGNKILLDTLSKSCLTLFVWPLLVITPYLPEVVNTYIGSTPLLEGRLSRYFLNSLGAS